MLIGAARLAAIRSLQNLTPVDHAALEALIDEYAHGL